MYNRYIPQSDGSYRRNRVEDPRPKPPYTPKPIPEPPKESCPPPKPESRHHQPVQERSSAGAFLRQLLPKDFDTGDMIVMLLLLLLAGDCEEDRANALLTLALYMIM